MPKPNPPAAALPEFPKVAALVDNAVDFLRAAIRDLDTSPKHSVIAFYSAVELFLKARLMAEHWTLVVMKGADRQKFMDGDFVSVTFEEACDRLAKVLDSPLPKETIEAFDRVRKHRNKMVHFYHTAVADEAALQDIAFEQLHAWLALQGLLRQWKNEVGVNVLRLLDINKGFSKHRQYYRARFQNAKAEIEQLQANGAQMMNCDRCDFEAVEITEGPKDLFTGTCLVCFYSHGWVLAPCPVCGEMMGMAGQNEGSCSNCGKTVDTSEAISLLNEEGQNFSSVTPANCGECGEQETVVEWSGEYLCVSCLERFERVNQCERCESYNTADMGSSIIKGCGFC